MSLKFITPSNNTGHTPVGSDDFQQGMVAALDSNGNAVLAGTESAASTNGPKNKAVGIFGDDHITTTLKNTNIVGEELILASGVAVALSHDSVIANSQRVTLKTGGTLLTETTDYTFSDSAGTLTSTGTQANGTIVLVTYSFGLDDTIEKDFVGVNYRGSRDDAEGSQKATIWKGYSEFETDRFVTSQSYAIGNELRYTHSTHDMGAGLLTNQSGGSTVVDVIVGRVSRVPTAANPFLGVDWYGTASDLP